MLKLKKKNGFPNLFWFLLFGSRNKTDATNFKVLLNTLTTDGDNGVVRVGVMNFIVHENFNSSTKVRLHHTFLVGDSAAYLIK